MNRKKIEIIAAILVIIALIVLVVFLLTRKKAEDVTPTPEDTTSPADELPPVQPEDVPPPAEVSGQTVSRIFVERFGSYSSESDFQNITDVLSLATPGFQAQLQTLANTPPPSEYYGVSTFVISSKVTAETETTMTLWLTTQRREAIGTPGNTSTRYQDIEVRLEKSGEDWLISGYTWQD